MSQNIKAKKFVPKQRVFRVTGIAVIAVILIHIVHAVTLDRIIQYKEVSFSHPNIPAELNGYTIAFVSDTHNISERNLQGIVTELNSRQIDLLILGGDYSVNGGETCMTILSQVQTADGIFGVEGNHDNHVALYENMENHGIIPLDNTGFHVQDGFFLAGVRDFYRSIDSWDSGYRRRSRICIPTAISDSDDGDFVLLVSHSPDIVLEPSDLSNVNLVLSGHTHGGHIAFFGVFAPGLWFVTESGHRFKSGWAESDCGTAVLVGNGVGGYVPRVFARPQVVILTLVSE
jgi:hypothetical protein